MKINKIITSVACMILVIGLSYGSVFAEEQLNVNKMDNDGLDEHKQDTIEVIEQLLDVEEKNVGVAAEQMDLQSLQTVQLIDINGVKVRIDEIMMTRNGRVYLPIRFAYAAFSEPDRSQEGWVIRVMPYFNSNRKGVKDGTGYVVITSQKSEGDKTIRKSVGIDWQRSNKTLDEMPGEEDGTRILYGIYNDNVIQQTEIGRVYESFGATSRYVRAPLVCSHVKKSNDGTRLYLCIEDFNDIVTFLTDDNFTTRRLK